MKAPKLDMTDQDWRLRAACRGMEPKTPNEVDIFFPQALPGRPDGPAMRKLLREPKSICRDCPVMLECRLFAVAVGAETGVWGGIWFGQYRNRREVAW